MQTVQNTVNISTHITKTPTSYKTHTHTHITIQVKTNTVQDTPKLNSHNTTKYLQYKVTLMYMVLLPQELHRNSLHFNIKSLHINSHRILTVYHAYKRRWRCSTHSSVRKVAGFNLDHIANYRDWPVSLYPGHWQEGSARARNCGTNVTRTMDLSLPSTALSCFLCL